MRWSWLLVASLVGACGSSSSSSEPQPAVAGPQAVAEPDTPAVGLPDDAPKASGKRLGIGFAANMVGEIEPCGCKSNPSGGLARRMTILEAWRHGHPDAKHGETPPEAKPPVVAEKLAQAPPESKIAPMRFDGFLILDAGDAFAENPMLSGDRLASATKTAELIVTRFSEEGMAAQLIGDKDLALGLDALRALQKRASYPFIATNLVDARTQANVFDRKATVEVAGLKVGIIGLISMNASRAPTLGEQGLALLNPIEAAKVAVAELRDHDKVDVIVALSQLSPHEQEAAAQAIPAIQLFLGGDQLGMAQGPQPLGSAYALSGGHKGRQVAIAALTFDDPSGARAPFFDPHQKSSLEHKLRDAKSRVQTYERLLAEAEKQDAAEPAEPAAQPDSNKALRRRSPLAAYRNQLAAAKADLALAEGQLADTALVDKPQTARNTVSLQLFNLGREVPDHEAVKAKVDAFRKDHPASHVH